MSDKYETMFKLMEIRQSVIKILSNEDYEKITELERQYIDILKRYDLAPF